MENLIKLLAVSSLLWLVVLAGTVSASLVIQDFQTTKPVYTGTETVTRATVYNNGSSGSGGYSVQFQVENGTGDPVAGITENYESLPPEGFREVSFEWSSSSSGVHTVNLTVKGNLEDSEVTEVRVKERGSRFTLPEYPFHSLWFLLVIISLIAYGWACGKRKPGE